MKGCLVALALIIAVPLVWVFAEAYQRSDFERPDTTAQPIDTTASELASAYASNEAAAQQRYSGAPLRISGRVSSISLNLTGGTVLHLDAGETSVSAHMLDSEKAWAASIAPGSGVILLCEDSSYLLGIPVVEHCIATTRGAQWNASPSAVSSIHHHARRHR
jgi:hypothetical protein